jgi:two-component system cell cycle sensor histidine kinase/response regulator CckA
MTSPLTCLVEFDKIPVIGMLLELDGTVVAANQAMCHLLAKRPEEIIGQKLDAFTRKGSAVHTQNQQSALVDELELDGPNGTCTIEVVMSIIQAEGRDILQLFGIEVTSRKLAEQAAKARAVLEQQSSARQRNEALGIVAGGIAHDFNNLLVGVLAEASAAREEVLPPHTLEALRRIENGARRMSQLTKSMLAYAGRGRVVNTRLDPDAFLRDLHDPLRKLARERHFAIAPAAGSCVIDADPNLLQQMLGNLVQNASDAKGTRIEVTSCIVMRQNTSWWQLEVGDDGEGIEPDALAHIFEPFYTTRSDQTGLGLSAVQGIVRRLGGEIEVDSRPRQGARFRVRLPVLQGVEAPARRTTTQGMAPVAKLAGLRVLIADDEPSVRNTVRRLLERRGANVEVAIDGSDAEQKLDGSFGLVILDVSMPGRTGYDVLAIARRRFPQTPVLLMSGYTEHTRGAGGEEPDGFLEKPFTARALDALIDQIMRMSEVARSNNGNGNAG